MESFKRKQVKHLGLKNAQQKIQGTIQFFSCIKLKFDFLTVNTGYIAHGLQS